MKINDIYTTLNNPSLQIQTLELKYTNYTIIKNVHNEYMICGYEPIVDDHNIRSTSYPSTYNNPQILFDLINLYINLKINFGHMRTTVESKITDTHIELILKFCKKYGLPYFGNIGEKDLAYNDFQLDIKTLFTDEQIHSLKKSCNANAIVCACCNLSFFLYHLRELYREFILYITINAPDTAEQYQTFLGVKLPKATDKLKESFNPVLSYSFDFSSHLHNSNGKFTFQIKTNNIFHLAVYYFCLICIGGETKYIEKLSILKQCKLCGSYFLTTQSRRKYCPYCSPQKAWNRKNR